MPWRDDPEPFAVFVSELMLQQTQVVRVIPKFSAFLKRFPDFFALASASFAEVLEMWSGLGYNRRARYVHDTARIIDTQYDGKLPSDPEILQTFPGIGWNTAGAITAFAFNRPVVFIETNIRRVYLHHFFPEQNNVRDRELFPIIERTLDRRNPREWYWALMDYGSSLAEATINPNRRSAHHVRQTVFVGSDRQLRGRILQEVRRRVRVAAENLPEYTGFDAARVQRVLQALQSERFLQCGEDGYYEIDSR